MDLETSTSTAQRQRVSLNGEWQFRHESGAWRAIEVPSVWQAQFGDLRLMGGSAV
jgi:beta-galactosidase/beta-glucuronidase